MLIQWNGDQPRCERVALDRRPREMSNLKFPHALHLERARRRGPDAARANGIGAASLECADCHTPTPDGVRFERVDMERNCGMCHSLSFDEIGGTIRHLRHGSPEQVIADIRGLYRAGGPAFPPELSPGARSRPGDVNQIRAAVQFARARAGTAERGERAIRAIFSAPSGTCFECHKIVAAAAGHAQLPASASGRRSRAALYRCTAGSITAPTRSCSGRASARAEGSAACLSCHTRRRTSQSATDLLLPEPAELPRLPWRRDAPACRCPRPARCATIIIWTRACPPSCCASACGGSAGESTVRGGQQPRAAAGARRED